jgi:hypothetical protein
MSSLTDSIPQVGIFNQLNSRFQVSDDGTDAIPDTLYEKAGIFLNHPLALNLNLALNLAFNID